MAPSRSRSGLGQGKDSFSAFVKIVRLPLAAAGFALSAEAAIAADSVSPIKHVIIIMQENRSFDHYFGTFPGANGIPSGVCVPLDPANPSGGCVKPFHDKRDANGGGAHEAQSATSDLDDGVTTAKMDGFVAVEMSVQKGFLHLCSENPPKFPRNQCYPLLASMARHGVMGYHTDTEIPNYWAYAKNFVLQDELFSGERSWSMTQHLDMTSEWSATCTDENLATTCTSDLGLNLKANTLPWVTLFQLFDQYNLNWKYYLGEGAEPDCESDEMICPPVDQRPQVGSDWNPTPLFAYVKKKDPSYLEQHVQTTEQFFLDVQNHQLPSVSWIVPSDEYSEHPTAGVTRGMNYVTGLVNEIMESPYWADTVIFITWDEWGGFYDHVVPPIVDYVGSAPMGYGLRVPGLMISAWARKGLIDHSVLSFDSYAKFIEDTFLAGVRLDPTALGNPDNRPDLRDSLVTAKDIQGHTVTLGDLRGEFDFSQTPLPPLLLPTDIPPDIAAWCNQDLATDVCQSVTVTISWSSVTPLGYPEAYSYGVLRDDLSLPACEGKITSCTDAPGAGKHYYRVYSVNAQGKRSPSSAAAFAEVPSALH